MEPLFKAPATLAILFGASEFPNNKGLPAFASFGRSVEGFRSYLLESLSLHPDNICNLFDSDAWPGQLTGSLKEWITKRKDACVVSDVFFFYVGHGVLDSGTFRMASRVTAEGSDVTDSSLSSKALKNILYTSASGANFYVILDCCYAASAHQDFQDTSSNSSAVLYTSAGARKEAIASESELYTRFFDALFAALTQGVESTDEHLSFRQLECRVDEIYHQRHPTEFVKPQLGAPNAPKVNVLNLPVFPNPGFKAAPLNYEYYTHWIRRNGAPEGLGRLTEQQVKQRKISTRMLREKGRVRKVETVNSFGLLTASYYNIALLSGSLESQDQECAWEFVYDEHGRVAREEVRNAFSHLLYRCEYSATDRAETTARYFLNPSDVVQPRAKSGAAYVKISRSDRGLDQRLEFFDGSEQKQPDDRGSYGQTMEFNAEGVAIRTVELGRAGNAAVCNEGYAIAEFTTNPFGNTSSQSYFDEARHPTLCQDGYHEALIGWSPEGNLISMAFFDISAEPVLTKSRCASWKATYDTAGNQTKQEYFGLDGKPIIIRDGHASWEASYNEQGRMLTLRFLDAGGNPAYSREGIARITYGYDISGQISEYRYLDADGVTPTADRESVSRLVLTFDGDGNITKRLNFGTNGQLTRNTEGVAGYETKYDPSGNEILVTNLDVDGNPGPNNSGIAKIRRSYDHRRRLTEETYLDVNDSAVENSDGYHRKVFAYDELPSHTSTRYFGRTGAPAFVDGYCVAIEQHDDRDSVVSREFRDSTNQPCWSAKGFAREQRSYDAMSRQVQQRYFGIDGTPVITSMGYAGWDTSYDARGNRIRMVYLDVVGRPVSGRPIEVFTFEANGNYVAKFLNAAGEPVVNADGVAERHVERDARGNDKKSNYRDVDGKPLKRNEGFAGWEATYDQFDNKVEQRLIDESGALTAQQNGTARTTWTYDTRQRKTSETFWEVAGNRLVVKPEAYAGWKAAYDDRGHQIELSYFGEDGEKLVDSQYGSARIASVYLDGLGGVQREWFRADGDLLYNLKISYDDNGGRTETALGKSGEAVVRSFDKAGHEIRCEYFRADGSRDVHRERDFAFSRFEEDFDQYGRSIEKRYFDSSDKLFRSVRRTYNPAGNEIETIESQCEPARNRTTRIRPLLDSRQIEVSFTDLNGSLVMDEYGRGRWVEHLSASGQRVKIEHFDTAGNPVLVHGHYSAKYKYDELDCLTEAIYSFPVDEDSILEKKFRFDPKGSSRVAFESVDPNGQREQREAYLMEYAMKSGDQIYYATRVVTSGNTGFEFRMKQVCQETRPDGSYVVSVQVIPPGGDWQSQGQYVWVTMTRSGKMIETSVQLESLPPPMPAYPVFAGDTWQMKNELLLINPFTGDGQKVTLDYSYLLRGVLTTENGFRLAQIEVLCPKTRVELGPAAAWSISGSGITLFEVDKGFLFASEVQCQILTSIGTDELLTAVGLTVEYYEPQEKSSVGSA